MGFWDSWDGASVVSGKTSSSHKHKHHKSSSHKSRKRSKSRSPARSHYGHSTPADKIAADIFGSGNSHYSKHNSSRSSFFNLGNNNSSRSLFGNWGRSSSSYYKRQPRSNFVQRMYKQLKRLLRDLIYYAKRHPIKVFMLVIMPLITGGALTALLARFGLRLPPGIERMLGIAARTAGGGGSMGLMGEAVRMASGMGGSGSATIERGRDGHVQWERRTVDQDARGGGGFMSSIGRMFS
ncbi:uncharacterized protein BCR38DRAFT_56737 [Pseudomassariella vexata]|uniref:Uncharacterized protein n=1 Tax=Pseudomassariella vexata TaxID=1141098 RepID=A0A1Y2DM01_9PEZI|nr:uncharacterized protein BCR38DRAFT_56737 [Pseudomassariella vexata]ORY60251.1 hypothetical protein BCR38DRAFT_56737 [Pseudomassariella vexata]